MEVKKLFKRKIGDEKKVDISYIDDDQRVAIIRGTTPDEIYRRFPELYHGLREMWIASFHSEDLDAPPEIDNTAKITSFIILGVLIIDSIILIAK